MNKTKTTVKTAATVASMESKIEPRSAYRKLRKYQRTAVDKAVNYIQTYTSNPTKTGLIAMPTGSGKTAIMAAVARCYTDVTKNVLIVSPRVAISKQIFKELGAFRNATGSATTPQFKETGCLFFNKKLKINEKIPKKVCYLNSRALPSEKSDIVMVSTVQMIHFLQQKDDAAFKLWIASIGLVIFDEGHYEPAKFWSQTIRSIPCPRLIFTATPFRNDFKSFDIDWSISHYISYAEVLSEKYLRPVDFKQKTKPVNEKDFVADVLKEYKARFNKFTPSKKLIINCDSKTSIQSITAELRGQGIPFIAIHERFTDDLVKDPNKKDHYIEKWAKKVPGAPEEEDAVIWIHQFKLLEGVDDPSFQMLAIFDPLRSTRELIQQIGRIIRNPDQLDDSAYVFNYSGEDLDQAWKDFLLLDKEGWLLKGFSQTVIDEIRKSLDEKVYLAKKFRTKFDSKTFEAWDNDELFENIQLPLKVNLLQKLGDVSDPFKLGDLCRDYIEPELANADKIFARNNINSKTVIYSYFTVENSEFLSKSYWPVISHDVCYIREFDDYVAFYDTSDMDIMGLDTFKIGMAIDPSILQKVFGKSNSSKLSRIELKNGNIGLNSIRRHGYTAPSLAETTPFLNDFAHFLGSIYGTYKDKKDFLKSKKKGAQKGKIKKEDVVFKSYLGFANGRISQHEDQLATVSEYGDWLEYLMKVVQEKSRDPDSLFDRYASQLSQIKVDDKIPKNIFIDLHDIAPESVSDNEKSWDDIIPDRCMNVTQTGTKYSFDVTVGTTQIEVEVYYDDDSKKIKLNAPSLDNGGTNQDTVKVPALIEKLNRKQAFRILAESLSLYANGKFYKPRLKYGKEFQEATFQLSKTFVKVDELQVIHSEKGKKGLPGGAGWRDDSVFGLIDRLGVINNKPTAMASYFTGTDMLVCDDLGTESADFILTTTTKMAFIHVKGAGNKPTQGSSYGATAIGAVCDQAIKNIHHLSMFDVTEPKHKDRLSEGYSNTNAKHKIDIKVKSRLRRWNGVVPSRKITSDEIWEKVTNLKFNASAEREVWLVLGKTLSVGTLFKELENSTPEAIQTALTLQSTLASVSSLGARLRIFCSP